MLLPILASSVPGSGIPVSLEPAAVPVFISSETNSHFLQSNVIVTAPSDPVEGDLLVCIILSSLFNTVVDTPPAGWTLQSSRLDTHDSEYAHQYVYTKVATASEPGTYTWVMSNASAGQITVCLRYRTTNATQTDAKADSFDNVNLSPPTEHTAPDITTLYARTLVLTIFFMNQSGGTDMGDVSTPAGTTKRLIYGNSPQPGLDKKIVVFEEVKQSPGLYSGKAMTTDENNISSSAHVMGIRTA